MKLLKKCPQCGKYTLKQECHGEAINPHPMKFNPKNKWGKYRRKAREPSKTTSV
ncbi:MAG: nucleolar RNA-binding Nop10p family protein [Candidatus Micrarchaeota archaeon]